MALSHVIPILTDDYDLQTVSEVEC